MACDEEGYFGGVGAVADSGAAAPVRLPKKDLRAFEGAATAAAAAVFAVFAASVRTLDESREPLWPLPRLLGPPPPLLCPRSLTLPPPNALPNCCIAAKNA